ncbi:MAG: hypothetical protein HW416_1343 [Chloroflexi bacterium]|nr:hypothetical protein [Chloroflexota bacterium]
MSEPNGHDGPSYTDFVHTGPGSLAGRYLRSFWQPIALSKDVEPGHAKPVRIMSEDFTLYRGQVAGDRGQEPRPHPLSTQHSALSTAMPHLLAFRCAHRGTQLSTGWVEGDDLRCFYHGWKYNADGQCIEQPAEPEPFCARIKIRSYPVHEYLGLIFAYLGEGQPPEFPRYELFEQEGLITIGTEHLACNFFNRMDNSMDPVHTKFVHRWPDYEPYGLVGTPTITADEQPWGVSSYITWPEWPEDEIDIHHVVMPNILLNKIDRGIHLAWRVPIDDGSSTVLNLAITPPDAVRKREGRDREASSYSSHEWGAAKAGRASRRRSLRMGLDRGSASTHRITLRRSARDRSSTTSTSVSARQTWASCSCARCGHVSYARSPMADR